MWNGRYNSGLEQNRTLAAAGGGEQRVEKQHASGKLTARERIELLFDKGSFVEIGMLRGSENGTPGDGVVTGYGRINGRQAFASSEDFTVNGGTLGVCHSEKICAVMDMAMNVRAPFISINDSGGARIDEGICSLSGYSGIFLRNTKASGVIPQIAVILGPCAGGACYSPAICDFVFMSEKNAQAFITGPAVVKTVTGEETTVSGLGGAYVHGKLSGVAHFVYPDDEACLNGVRELLCYLPQNNETKPPVIPSVPVDRSYEIENIVPDNQKLSYDVRNVISTFADKDSFFEIQKSYAENIVIGLARLDGNVIGIVANQPKHLAGSLDVNASDKAARFVRFCDCFNIPVLSLVDVTGYLPGTVQEHSGIIRHGAKLLYAYSEATVPKISLIMRKAYGGAYIAMNSKNMGADLVFAWPIAQLAVMGAEGAVNILNRRELNGSQNPSELRGKLIAEYEEKYLNPYIAAAIGVIDEVIMASDTRKRLSLAFEMLKTKKSENPPKKHGNIPL